MKGAIKVPWKKPEKTGPSLSEEAHADLVLMRLHALVRVGYRPKLGADSGSDSQIDLDHSNAQPLTLWPDGLVVDQNPSAINNDKDRTIINFDDDFTFKKFIESVPKPSIFQRILYMSVDKLISHIFGYSLYLIFIISISYFMTKWFH